MAGLGERLGERRVGGPDPAGLRRADELVARDDYPQRLASASPPAIRDSGSKPRLRAPVSSIVGQLGGPRPAEDGDRARALEPVLRRARRSRASRQLEALGPQTGREARPRRTAPRPAPAAAHQVAVGGDDDRAGRVRQRGAQGGEQRRRVAERLDHAVADDHRPAQPLTAAGQRAARRRVPVPALGAGGARARRASRRSAGGRRRRRRGPAPARRAAAAAGSRARPPCGSRAFGPDPVPAARGPTGLIRQALTPITRYADASECTCSSEVRHLRRR